MATPEAGRRTRARYLRTTLLVFAAAVIAFAVSAVAYDRQVDGGKELRDAIVPFAVFIVACVVVAVCALVFGKDVVGNKHLNRRERARWLTGFGLFPPLVFLYWWRHARR